LGGRVHKEDDSVRFGIRHGFKENAVDERENRRIRADAERYSRDRSEREIQGCGGTSSGNALTSNGVTSNQNCTIKITALLLKDLYNLPNAFVGAAYSYTLTALRGSGDVDPDKRITYRDDPKYDKFGDRSTFRNADRSGELCC